MTEVLAAWPAGAQMVGRSRREALGLGLTPRAIAGRVGHERLGKAIALRGSFCTGTRSDRHTAQPADRPACSRPARRHRWSGAATD